MPFTPLTKAELEDLWRRVFPASYTVPIEEENNGQGFDVPAAQAAIFEGVENSANAMFESHYLKIHADRTGDPAYGGARATTDLEITRVTSTVGDIVLDAGTRLVAEQIGTNGQTIRLQDFELIADLTMLEGNAGPFTAPARATIEGYAGNVAEGSIVRFRELGRATMEGTVDSTTVLIRNTPAPGDPATDRFTVGMIGRYVVIVGLASGVTYPRKIVSVNASAQSIEITPALAAGDVGDVVTIQVSEYEDLGLVVEQPDDATGGRLAMLDAIGRDRRSGRVSGETDGQYRLRLCDLSDTISPNAIRRTALRILGPCGVNFALKETRDVATLKGFVWDLDPFDFGQIGAVTLVAGSELVGQGAVMLSENWSKTAFILCVGFGSDGEFGAPYDATNPTVPNAWDQFFWDGSPVGYLSCIGQLWEELNGARAAGVNIAIVQDPALT